MKRIATPHKGVIGATGWVARLAIEAVTLGMLVAIAALLGFSGRMLRRINRRGLVGWGLVGPLVLLLTTVLIELVELICRRLRLCV